MRFLEGAFFVVLGAAFSTPIQADDFVSVVERNFPYAEVEHSYGSAKIEEGRCQEGTPFAITQEDSETGTKMDLAEQVHARLRSLGANAFIINDLIEDADGRRIMVTPLTCDLR